MRIWSSLHIPRVTILMSQSEVSVFIAIFLQEAMELYSMREGGNILPLFNPVQNEWMHCLATFSPMHTHPAFPKMQLNQYASGSSNDTADVFGSSQSQSTAPTFSLPSEAELFTTPQKNRARQQAARVC
jgi:hypothetical protein